MTSLDFLYYSIGIAIWAFIGLSVYVAINLVRLIDHIRTITKVAFDTALNIQVVRGGIKLGFYKFMQRILTAIRGGGAEYEQKQQ